MLKSPKDHFNQQTHVLVKIHNISESKIKSVSRDGTNIYKEKILKSEQKILKNVNVSHQKLMVQSFKKSNLFFFCLPPEFIPVLGPLTW